MFTAPAGNSYGASYYGTAAVSPALFGYNTYWLGEGCGKCWKVTGTSNINGKPEVPTTLMLKAANVCPKGSVDPKLYYEPLDAAVVVVFHPQKWEEWQRGQQKSSHVSSICFVVIMMAKEPPISHFPIVIVPASKKGKKITGKVFLRQKTV